MAGPNKFTIEDAPKSQFTIGDAGPDISSEASMAAHPPTAPKPAAMQTSGNPAVVSYLNRAAHAPTTLYKNNADMAQQMDQAGINAAKFGADTMIGQNIVGPPLARLAESHVLPALKALPFAGKVVSAIDEAPGLLGKAARGATVGGAAGGTEGLIRGHGLAGSAKDAAEGAAFGGVAGLALPAIHKLSGVEPEPPPFQGPDTPTEAQFRRSAKMAPEGSPQNPGWNSKIPNRMPKIASPTAEGTPETGGAVAAPQADVIRVPEPRELFPNEKVGYNASTPRKLLLDNALQGRPGAAEMLRNAGKTPLYVPESGYAPPKERIVLGGPTAESEPRYIYRAHTVGEPEIDLNAHAHATSSPEEAQIYAQHRNGGENQTVSRINANRFAPEHIQEFEGPRGNNWYKLKRQTSSEDYE